MVDIAALKVANAARWAAMVLDPSRIAEFDAVAARLCDPDAKAMYLAISAATGIPWFMVAVWHERESGQRWDRQLAQGDPLGEKSVNVPEGRGPFFGPDAFYRGALDALIDCPPYAAKWTDWTPGGAITITDKFNGLGYAIGPTDVDGTRYPPQASPYSFSGCDQYTTGKYVADRRYVHSVKDVQLGCAPLLKRMMFRDTSIKFASAPGVFSIPAPHAAPPAPTTVHIVAPNFVRAIRNLF